MSAALPPQEFGSYRLLRLLGGGGYGSVYLAEQKPLGRWVALKILSRTDEGALRRFRREAEILARLRDPRIVPVHDHGENLGFWYFAMEFVAGVSLEELLGRARERGGTATAMDVRSLLPELSVTEGEKALPYVPFVVARLAGVCESLEKVHVQGIVHRDLKPANLILDRSGECRVIDFGLAREAGRLSLSSEGGKVGTTLYMSPEQVRGRRDLDQRTDVYSLAVVLYELLSLKNPFEAEARDAIERKILDGCAPPLRALDPRIPRELEAVVAKAMHPERGRRYGSAGDFADELRRFLRGEPVLARPSGAIRRLGRRVLRRPKAAAACLGLLLLSTASFVRLSGPPQDRWAFYAQKRLEKMEKMRDSGAARPAEASARREAPPRKEIQGAPLIKLKGIGAGDVLAAPPAMPFRKR